MSENKQTIANDPELSITLKASEIFQLNLCVVSRLGFCQQKWASAITENEQNACESQITYLTNLSSKLQEILKEIK